ncbi:MAG: dethiobiotin synthase [Planctomycetota bacterium]
MFRKPPLGLFVTGTDTEVGKTYVAALIVKALKAQGHRVGVYKPVASDCVHDGSQLVAEDALVLWNAAGNPLTMDDVCPQRFRAPISPHLSAKSEGKQIDAELLRNGLSVWADQCDIVIVEGSGGLMSPMTDDEFVADLAFEFGYPLVLVTANVLGAINQTMQTLITAACFRDGLDVAGIILNDAQIFEGDVSIDSNQQEISKRTDTPVLSRVRYQQAEIQEQIDWFALAQQQAVQT